MVALAVVPWGCAESATKPDLVQGLSRDLKGFGWSETKSLLLDRFGPPDRDVGSGEVIEQWDAFGGTLTLSGLGLVFTKAGASTRLTQATNLAEECLLGSYEMTTIPTDDRGAYWLGSINVDPLGAYHFEDSRAWPEHKAAQAGNYFMLHPSGTVRVDYSEGVGPATRLEVLKHGQSVATLTFVASDSPAVTSIVVVAATERMDLVFESAEPRFRMARGWLHYWPTK